MKKIMVIDDDENVLLLCTQELTEEGYRVVTAHDGKEALHLLEHEKPDVVVLDIVMPKMDGLEAMGKIIRRMRKTPIVINSSYSAYKDDFKSWPADAYVLKSADLHALKRTIKDLLHRHRSPTSAVG
jgi:CheY-like chemotaxis protein